MFLFCNYNKASYRFIQTKWIWVAEKILKMTNQNLKKSTDTEHYLYVIKTTKHHRFIHKIEFERQFIMYLRWAVSLCPWAVRRRTWRGCWSWPGRSSGYPAWTPPSADTSETRKCAAYELNQLAILTSYKVAIWKPRGGSAKFKSSRWCSVFSPHGLVNFSILNHGETGKLTISATYLG